jgi:hypothetical protein
MVKTRLDISGQRYRRLVAISPHSQDKFQRWKWNCVCDCGRMVVVSSNNLRTGNSKSCGCLDAESRAVRGRRSFIARRGSKHYRWIEDRNLIKSRPASIKKWRAGIISGNPGGCFKCGSEERLHAHHADSYAGSSARRLDPLNGVPLCSLHHREFHAIHGRDNTTQEQLHEYLGYPDVDRDLVESPLLMPTDPKLRLIAELIMDGNLDDAVWHLQREIARLKATEAPK